MKRIIKIFILSFILLILSISAINASELQNNDLDKAIVDAGDKGELILDSICDDSNSNLDENIVCADEESESALGLEESSESKLDDNINQNNKNSLKADSSTVHQVNPNTYSQYFKSNGYVITTIVSPGDTIDLSGRFLKKNFIFNIPCTITSSQNDAYLSNCMIEFENVTSDIPSSVSNLNFNTSIEKAPCVYLLGSSNVEVYNNTAYSTGANSNPTLLVGSSYCSVHDNVYETTFTGYMNMSWKRAGILLGESHYNTIYFNHVTVKDSNGIYLTTYGFEKSNHNKIYNNTVTTSAFSEDTGLRNPSAWAYGIHIMGDYNQILNNTVMNTYRGVDSEGSFNLIVGNYIFNLSGSYYEGNDGTDGGEGGIFSSYNNIIINNTICDSKITGPAIYVVVNTTVIGNTIKNITGPNGIQFALSASNCLIDNNTIDMNGGNAVYIKGNMSNLTLSHNIISTNNGTGILIQKQSRSKYPVDVIIVDNCFLENSKDYINFTDVLSKTKITLRNNTVVVVNDTFFQFFGSDGSFTSNDLFENFILKGQFSDLIDSAHGSSQSLTSIDLNGKISILGDNAYLKDISFNINSNNVKVDNILVNITDAVSNAFNFNKVKNSTLTNSKIYFNSTDPALIAIFADNSKTRLENNTIIVYSDNIAFVLNNTECNLTDNRFNSSSLSQVTIWNDNNSCIYYGENEINSVVDPAIISINGAIIKYTYFIIEDSNYYEYFNPDGSFLDDVIFNFGDTIRIGNVNNKIFRFDIPLIILGQQGSTMNNCSIFLEGESSNSRVSNFTFNLEDKQLDGDISFITVKDGVSNLIIDNNKFNINNSTCDYASLNLIKIILSDFESSNILIKNNLINVDSNLSQVNGIIVRNQGLGLSAKSISGLSILNNSISLINLKDEGISNGINLLSSSDSLIENNSIFIKSYNANGILLERSNLTILNNTIEVYGLNYEKIMDYISNNTLKDLIEDNQIKADSAIAIDKNTLFNDDIIDENILIENGGQTKIIHLSNIFKDLENIISNAQDGSDIDLGNNVYIIYDTIDIDKSIKISKGILISALRETNVLFKLLASSEGSFNLSNSTILLDNSNIFVLADSLIGDDKSIINLSSINIKDNDFLAIEDKVVPESITLLRLISYGNILNTNNNISIAGNRIQAGMRAFQFDVRPIVNGSDILITNVSSLYERTPTKISYKNMNTTTVDTDTDGRIGQYFNVTLTDDEGNPLSNKEVLIGFNGVIYKVITDEKGICRLQINLGYAGDYTFAISFLGDDEYKASFAVAKICVKKQNPLITCSNYYYKAYAKAKKISISLKSASRKPLKNRLIKLVLNGKTYSAKTNSKGIATINVSVATKKTYSFAVKYAGDHLYSAVSKTAKLIVS